MKSCSKEMLIEASSHVSKSRSVVEPRDDNLRYNIFGRRFARFRLNLSEAVVPSFLFSDTMSVLFSEIRTKSRNSNVPTARSISKTMETSNRTCAEPSELGKR